jgi:hypothetical protein
MASIAETGHAVNISNYKLLIDKCNAFGVIYNPSNADLKIVPMTTQWTSGKATHDALTAALQASKGPINAREILFEPVDKLVTRTINYFNSTNASAQIKLDAKGLADRYRGFGIKVETLPDGSPDPAHVSNSHQSYVQKADTFKQLVDLYNSEPLYAPNENELKIVALTALSTAMKTSNDNIGTIIAPVDTLRIARDHALYDEETGIVDMAGKCKDYVKGLFGATSPEARTVIPIKFTRPSED